MFYIITYKRRNALLYKTKAESNTKSIRFNISSELQQVQSFINNLLAHSSELLIEIIYKCIVKISQDKGLFKYKLN